MEPITNRTRNTVVGTTAGLLGGAAVGLLLTVPSFTSAAPALQDDTDTSTEAPVDGERPEPGEQLRELLDELVPGTLTAEQADAVAEHLIENRPERPDKGRHGRRGGPGMDGEVVSDLLGIDTETLREEIRSGKSIADIAGEQGVAVDSIVTALVDELEGHLDLAVEDGRLTEAEADERLAASEERITDMVNGELGPRESGPGSRRGGGFGGQPPAGDAADVAVDGTSA